MIKEMMYWLWTNFKTHIGNSSAHHTDHQAASGEDAEFKSVNIIVGQRYEQDGKQAIRLASTNLLIGDGAGIGNLRNPGNTCIGYKAGKRIDFGMNNIYLGYAAGETNENGSYNVLIGANCLRNANGYSDNVVIGYEAQKFSAGGENVIIGLRACKSGSSGLSYKNVIIGCKAGYLNNGKYSVKIGYKSGYTYANEGCVLIGYQAGYSETGNNILYIENSNNSIPLIWGDFVNKKVGIHMKPDISKFGVDGIIEYADNAAAVTAGLGIGEFYRTGDILKIVHT